jgi:hypothetical protein
MIAPPFVKPRLIAHPSPPIFQEKNEFFVAAPADRGSAEWQRPVALKERVRPARAL